MLDLALHYGEKSVLLRDVARRQEISEPYMELLMGPLRKSGLVMSYRGAHGGYRLGRHPSEIILSEIVEAVEGPCVLVECTESSKNCSRSDCCAAREVWQKVGDAVQKVLSGITLEDLSRRQQELEQSDVPMYHI
jgi:Rrf2 family protein